MKSYEEILVNLREIQNAFEEEHGVNDIFSNSKIYEIQIANMLNHDLIPGHSGSRDARLLNMEFEYKHYKETSSNHSWTFNDFSDTTIAKLKDANLTLIFAHIQDSKKPAVFDWYYEVSGLQMHAYLKAHTKSIKNSRKMINVSANQIEARIGVNRTNTIPTVGRYEFWLKRIFEITDELEVLTGVPGVITSNKIWEVVVAAKLNHKVNGEQGGRAGAHDASDEKGRWYEYKVAKGDTWSFQDISDAVLEKYYETEAIICATVDKTSFGVVRIITISPEKLVPFLRKRRDEKKSRLMKTGVEMRRNQISLGKRVLLDIGGELVN
jgi:hypothetical protein